MAIRADSYSSTSEVKAFTAHLLDGASIFNSTTRPTLVEVEKFIDRASSHLNIALVGAGFAAPVTNSTAKLTLDDWVTARATEYVELTQRGMGFNEDEGSRYVAFRNLSKSAKTLVDENYRGFVNLGLTLNYHASDGLQFTGADAVADRADPDDTSLEQPKFTRRTFDNADSTEDDE